MLNRFGLFALFLFFAFSVPCVVHAAADLRVNQSDIRFSKSPLIAGDTVRVYTKVQNVGTTDVTGYVTFYQGSSVISEPQVISVVSGSDPEEVFVDFIVPEGSFNIRAVINGTNPADTNLDNNVSITGMLTPVPDDDHDGKQNASDNCPKVSNADQTDTDKDGLGDVCDDDMDGDSLTNSVEAELGTNPKIKDTDADGADDAHDAYPLDPKRTVIEKPVPVKPAPKPSEQQVQQVQLVANTPVSQTNPEQSVSGSFEAVIPTVTALQNANGAAAEPNAVTDATSVRVSPNAVFTYEQSSWNTFVFRLVAPAQDRFVYEWNFGDGVRSSKTNVTHTYSQAGTYQVKLRTTEENGNVSEESAEIHVSFFTFSNPLVIGLLSVLGVLLFGAFAAWLRMRTQKRPLKHIHVQEE